MYSFTKPKQKNILKEDTKLWLIFIGISSILYIAFTLFLEIKAIWYNNQTIKFRSEIFEYEHKIDKLNIKKALILQNESFYKEIINKNDLMKNNIKNLLDLVPDPITLNSIQFNKNSLIIYGITPSKDIFNTFMLPPLKSIFDNQVIHFYQMENGWYKFVCKNYSKESK